MELKTWPLLGAGKNGIYHGCREVGKPNSPTMDVSVHDFRNLGGHATSV